MSDDLLPPVLPRSPTLPQWISYLVAVGLLIAMVWDRVYNRFETVASAEQAHEELGQSIRDVKQDTTTALNQVKQDTSTELHRMNDRLDQIYSLLSSNRR